MLRSNLVFKQFRKRHKGQTAILFGTGPSINYYTPIKEVDGPYVKVGVKSILGREDIRLDYYFCGDINPRSQPDLDRIADYPIGIEKFGYTLVDGKSDPAWLNDQQAKALGLQTFEISKNILFERDISHNYLVNRSITFPALQFILYTGVTRIYLVGHDCSNYLSYIDTRSRARGKVVTFHDKMIEMWTWAKEWMAKDYPKVEVISINPVHLRKLFPHEYQSDKIKKALWKSWT